MVHPLVLVAGYLTVWVLAAAGFRRPDGVLVQATTAVARQRLCRARRGARLAGLYQFSSLKEACLKKCRNPFSILFSRWSSAPLRILRLGAEQGVWCLGCCWALMLVMFAVGTMNIFWMALIGLFTVVEKQTAGSFATRLAGAILLVWAAALLLVSR